MAKWWELDPDITAAWTFPDWLNRQEFMWIRKDVDDPPPPPKKEPWQGPKNRR